MSTKRSAGSRNMNPLVRKGILTALRVVSRLESGPRCVLSESPEAYRRAIRDAKSQLMWILTKRPISNPNKSPEVRR